MKSRNKIILVFSLFLSSFLTPAPAQAWDLNHLISGGVKAVQAATVSDKQIQQYVAQYVAYQDQQSKIAPANSPYTQRLNKITQGLKKVGNVPLNFKVYVTNEINAFACADGSVRVYSGLMDKMTDDEILGVIGHEVGHVAHKDTKRAFKNALLTSALLDGLGATSSTAAMLTDSQLGALAQNLISARYSRKEETEADNYGYDFLKKAGKNPWALASAFTKLGSLENNSSTAMSVRNLFSSHPATTERIKNIAKKARKDKYPQPAGLVIPQ